MSRACLQDTQKRFFGALLQPLFGAGRAKDKTDLPENSGPEKPTSEFTSAAESLLRSTPAVGAVERLDLYHRSYWYRLFDTLAGDFPRLAKLMGSDAFWKAMESYLYVMPSRSFTLNHLGSRFSAFLETDLALPEETRLWAADVARFEYAHMRAFEAAQLPLAGKENFESSKLKLQPSVFLIEAKRPVATWAKDTQQVAYDLPREAQLIAVWRSPGNELRFDSEDPAFLPLLKSLQRGGTLAEIIENAESVPEPELLGMAFARWGERGWLGLPPA